jgi:Zn-dependent protease
MAFNLLPLPPLDGSGAIPLLLPERAARAYLGLLRQPVFSFAGLLVAWRLFGPLFDPLHTLALNLLYPEFLYRPG